MPSKCQICDEKLNKRSHKPIECESCSEICCSECFGRYTLGTLNPICMFCKASVTDDFIEKVSTQKFFKQFKEHKSDIIFSGEKSLLPSTQPTVEKILRVRKYENIWSELRSNKKKLEKERIEKYPVIKGNKERIKKRKEFSKHINDIQEEMIQTHRILNNILYRDDHGEEKPVNMFTKPCPDGDCRGYLSSAYKCGTCESYFCHDCHEKKDGRNDTAHVCDEDTKATINMLKKDTKPCPKCSVLIHRTEGCLQMWCVKCHCFFNWNTGHIETGVRHNPHYFQYLRETGQDIPRQPGDAPYDPCADLNNLPRYSNITRLFFKDQAKWVNIYDYTAHIVNMKTTLPANIGINDHEDLRIKFMLSEINENEWKKRLKMKIKKNEKNHEIYNVYDMFHRAMADSFHNLIEHKNLDIFQDESAKLVKYANDQLLIINKKFSSVDRRFLLDENFIRRT